MPTQLQSRTQFLALAEFCQKLISSLYDYIAGELELDKNTLGQARHALESVRSGDPYRFGQRSAAAFNSYEQLRTLEQVWTEDQIADAARLTTELLADGTQDDVQKEKAKGLLELFSKLQTRALWNFEQPSQTPPPDLRELCEALKTA